jgi:two-component system sensor histidine kinase KdpD
VGDIRSDDLSNVTALVELCDAQQQVIDRLQRALDEHEAVEADRHMLKRMLAHELRTPLAAVIGALHTLAMPEIPEEKAADLRGKALRQAQQLNALIDDILELADPHEPSVDRSPQEWVDAAELLDDVVAAVAGRVALERLTIDAEPGLVVRTIPGRLRQVLVNLVVNAAKFSPAGEPVALSVTRLPDAVVFEVVDRGPGIPTETVEALFQPFRRGDHAGVEGVGLGLYLIRNLVRSLAGTIELRPRDTGGTLARVTLPQKRLEDATAPPARARHLRSVRPTG